MILVTHHPIGAGCNRTEVLLVVQEQSCREQFFIIFSCKSKFGFYFEAMIDNTQILSHIFWRLLNCCETKFAAIILILSLTNTSSHAVNFVPSEQAKPGNLERIKWLSSSIRSLRLGDDASGNLDPTRPFSYAFIRITELELFNFTVYKLHFEF